MVRLAYCATDPLQTGVAIATDVKRSAQQLQQAGQHPKPELARCRPPFAEVFVQARSGNAGSRNPENHIQNEAMGLRPITNDSMQGNFSSFIKPLNHGSLLKSYLGSDTTPLLCQYLLGELLVAAA